MLAARVVAAVLLLVSLASTVGCDDEPSGAADIEDVTCTDIDNDVDASTEDDLEVAPDIAESDLPEDLESTFTLSVLVQRYDLGFPGACHIVPSACYPHVYDFAVHFLDEEPPLLPVEGVSIAVDLEAGTRLGEAESGADGLAVFEIPEWMWPEEQVASVTCYGSGFLMLTRAYVARPAGDEPLPLTLTPELESLPESVRISGSTTNLVSAQTALLVGSTPPHGGWHYANDADSYGLQTPVGVPFDLIAISFPGYRTTWEFDSPFSQVARVSSIAVEAATTIPIDFEANAIRWTIVEGSFPMPTRAESPLLRHQSAGPHHGIYVGESFWSGFTGVFTHGHLNGDTFEYTAELVETPELGGSWYAYAIETDVGESEAYGRGLPEGPQERPLDLPQWRSRRYHPVDQPLHWRVFDENVQFQLWIASVEVVRWIVEVPEDATQVTLPSPPTGVELEGLIGVNPRALIGVQRRFDRDQGVFWLQSWGKWLTLDLGE